MNYSSGPGVEVQVSNKTIEIIIDHEIVDQSHSTALVTFDQDGTRNSDRKVWEDDRTGRDWIEGDRIVEGDEV